MYRREKKMDFDLEGGRREKRETEETERRNRTEQKTTLDTVN